VETRKYASQPGISAVSNPWHGIPIKQELRGDRLVIEIPAHDLFHSIALSHGFRPLDEVVVETAAQAAFARNRAEKAPLKVVGSDKAEK
jgi:EAL domain-containing protein (putative c-di-GMP-specific phosphodiesterase class I)